MHGLADSVVSEGSLAAMIQSAGRVITRLGYQASALGIQSETIVASNAWNSCSFSALVIPAQTLKDIPTSTGGAAFPGDIRATSGLGKGDGIKDHTGKWMQGNGKSPLQYIAEAEPILVEGPVVASHGCELTLMPCYSR